MWMTWPSLPPHSCVLVHRLHFHTTFGCFLHTPFHLCHLVLVHTHLSILCLCIFLRHVVLSVYFFIHFPCTYLSLKCFHISVHTLPPPLSVSLLASPSVVYFCSKCISEILMSSNSRRECVIEILPAFWAVCPSPWVSHSCECVVCGSLIIVPVSKKRITNKLSNFLHKWIYKSKHRKWLMFFFFLFRGLRKRIRSFTCFICISAVRTNKSTASSTCARWWRRGTSQHALGKPTWRESWRRRE